MAGRQRAGSAAEAELQRAAAYRTALRHFLRRTESAAAQAGLTSQRYDLLLMIRSAGRDNAVRVSELCELLEMQQTAVTELVKRAEEGGLIERRPSSEDGRVWLLALTDDGEQRLMQVFRTLERDRAALADAFREVNMRFQAASGPSG